MRVIVLAAAVTGLRHSELIGLRWRDVDWGSQRIRVRNAYVRGGHSSEGKSDLSTRRSAPTTDRLVEELQRWRRRSVFDHADDVVFVHPELGTPSRSDHGLDRLGAMDAVRRRPPGLLTLSTPCRQA